MGKDQRQRLRWWLRGERALGLNYVHAPGAQSPGDFSTAVLDEVANQATAAASLKQLLAEAAGSITSQGPARREIPRQIAANPTPHPTFEIHLPTQSISMDESAIVPVPQSVSVPLFQDFSGVPELSPAEKAAALAALDASYVKGCVRCPLHRTRRNTVFGEGDPNAKLMFVGEGPGGTEDATGRPFVGRAGDKLTEMIRAMGLERSQVYICNVVKCRAFLAGPPPKDRPPQPEEASTCMPYLHQQIEIVRPQTIVTLGLSAMQYLLGVKQSMSRMRGNWQAWRGIPVMPTFHPSYILRNPTVETRRAVWEDLKQVMARLGIVTSGRR